jgi:outer membrane protein OmpA-like peptidoglycan-associated protein
MSALTAKITRVFVWLLPVALAAGCVSVSAEQQAAAQAQLKRAQDAYAQASADPNVQASGQLALLDAQTTLQAAERASDVKDVQQLGYIAERKSQIATAAGEARKTEQETQALTKETQDLLLQKREAEAKAARAELEKARQENEARAKQLQAQAAEIEKAKTEAEHARMAADARAREVEVKAREAEQARMQVTAAQAQTAALTKELSELKATQTDRGVVLTVGSALFATGKADVAPGIQRGVERLVTFLQDNPKRNVLVEGHTDDTGGGVGNVKLSQERADAIKNLLVSKGISPDRIVAKGYGSQYPRVANDSEAGRQQNRRVEVVILNEGVSAQSATR